MLKLSYLLSFLKFKIFLDRIYRITWIFVPFHLRAGRESHKPNLYTDRNLVSV